MKQWIAVMLSIAMLTALVGCAKPNEQKSVEAVIPSASESASENPDKEQAQDGMKELTEEEKALYIKYIEMNPFTFQTWSNPEEIESFRFGTFYGCNAGSDPKYAPQQYAVDDTLIYEIPQDVLEEYVRLYFDVSSAHLRTSDFYNEEKKIYTGFLAGGGMPVEYEIESVEVTGLSEEITYKATSEDGESRGAIGIDNSGDHFKFIFVKQL